MSTVSIADKPGRYGWSRRQPTIGDKARYMGHRRVLIAALFMILPDLPAISQQPGASPSGSAAEAGEIWGAERRDAELNLNQAFDKLVGLLSAKHVGRDGRDESMEYVDKRGFDAFKAEQHAWLRYLAAKCELEGTLTGGSSPWQSAYGLQCEADAMKKRTQSIVFATSCVEHIVGDSWSYDIFTCRNLLYALESRE